MSTFPPTAVEHRIDVWLDEGVRTEVHRRLIAAGDPSTYVNWALTHVVLGRLATQGVPGVLVPRVCSVRPTRTGAIVTVTRALYEQLLALGDPSDLLAAALELDPADAMYE
jgi:hypothetical protein